MKHYPGIERATLLIALDNGGINRSRSEKKQKSDLVRFLDRDFGCDLNDVDAWILSLREEELEVACCGESSEMEELMKSAPPGTNQFLNDYFEEVC